MTKQKKATQKSLDYKALTQAAIDGTMPDAENPIFIFSMTSTSLLRKIASGEIDAVALAKHQLEQRFQTWEAAQPKSEEY